eukprot:CAMPEP_0174320830 /NCGR_PEP_ID=MMETSP0810-20121108/9835_1 /TAXON_ID=73025 ORGANISM="Eutreptiella gymnastica-like, Strain CCMP1594" /NCGR_SAMPLE_ID=MMETSP0810 /ASSEMBLY_ACC=CAM_ASM_000659 /LENGTH=110 /DNA_ID=CAMNT_0015431921 /DNA_START=120 /DNA_END=452 /DNA_ORIENTATION=+
MAKHGFGVSAGALGLHVRSGLRFPSDHRRPLADEQLLTLNESQPRRLAINRRRFAEPCPRYPPATLSRRPTRCACHANKAGLSAVGEGEATGVGQTGSRCYLQRVVSGAV